MSRRPGGNPRQERTRARSWVEATPSRCIIPRLTRTSSEDAGLQLHPRTGLFALAFAKDPMGPLTPCRCLSAAAAAWAELLPNSPDPGSLAPRTPRSGADLRQRRCCSPRHSSSASWPERQARPAASLSFSPSPIFPGSRNVSLIRANFFLFSHCFIHICVHPRRVIIYYIWQCLRKELQLKH